MSEIFEVRLLELRPSQLYVSRCKLRAVDYTICCGGAGILQPLPVWEYQGQWVLTDGHTRALALYLKGYQKIRVYRDPEELETRMYLCCLDWCQQEGVLNIADLTARVLEHREFEQRWIQRCQKMHQALQMESH